MSLSFRSCGIIAGRRRSPRGARQHSFVVRRGHASHDGSLTERGDRVVRAFPRARVQRPGEPGATLAEAIGRDGPSLVAIVAASELI